MRIKIYLILLFFPFSFLNGQKIDSIVVCINGQIIDDTFKTAIRFPEIKIAFADGSSFIEKGDSLGNYFFKNKVRKSSNVALLTIFSKEYFTANEKVFIDTANSISVINKNINMTPSITCIDTWLFPDLLFKENSIIYNKYIKSSDTLLLIDSVIADWVKYFLEKRSELEVKIEILSYSDYTENNRISRQRLELIYNKLISLGISPNKLIKKNCNKNPFSYYKFRDGCFPSYALKKEPLVIDKAYIDSLTNKVEKDSVKQLRRIVTFSWKF